MYTSHDEAIVQSQAGKIGVSGRHQLVSFLLNKCTPTIKSNSGTTNWSYTDSDGKSVIMYTTQVRNDGNSAIYDGRATANLFKSVGKILSADGVDSIVSESRKEEMIRQLEKIFEGINKVFSLD